MTDVTTATPDEIRTMTVLARIVNGLSAFCADPEAVRHQPGLNR